MTTDTDTDTETRLVRTGNKKRGDVYHTDPDDCPSVHDRDSFRPVTTGEVQQRDLRECEICTGECLPTRRSDGRKCPKCGDTFTRLPRHLTACDGGDA
jgi:hypothetical protein